MTTIFVDFDGTITEEDLLDRIAQTFGDQDVYREVDEGLDQGRLTLNEVLRREFEPVRAPLETVVEWVLEHAHVRAGFEELVELSRARGWRLLILSSGFRELIQPVLEREGLGSVELVSNAIHPDPSGWRIDFRSTVPCPVCGEPCKRSTLLELADASPTIYVGDGFSDQCAAEASGMIFARRRLATYLTERGLPFEPFEDFHDVIEGIVRAS